MNSVQSLHPTQDINTVYGYILKLKDGKCYCGITKDLFQRLQQHCSKGKGYCQRIGVERVLLTETFKSYKEARAWEIHVKQMGVSRYYNKFSSSNAL